MARSAWRNHGHLYCIESPANNIYIKPMCRVAMQMSQSEMKRRRLRKFLDCRMTLPRQEA